jgi:hypothetical protein
MKLIVLLLLAVSLNVHATSPMNGMSEDQRAIVLKTIDNRCGDTWCEGDYEYDFNTFTQNKLGHILNFKMRLRDSVPWHKVSCQLSGRSFRAYIEQTGSQYELVDTASEELNDCISDLEAKLNKINKIMPPIHKTVGMCSPVALTVCKAKNPEQDYAQVKICQNAKGDRASLSFYVDGEWTEYQTSNVEIRMGATTYRNLPKMREYQLIKSVNLYHSAKLSVIASEAKSYVYDMVCSH